MFQRITSKFWLDITFLVAVCIEKLNWVNFRQYIHNSIQQRVISAHWGDYTGNIVKEVTRLRLVVLTAILRLIREFFYLNCIFLSKVSRLKNYFVTIYIKSKKNIPIQLICISSYCSVEKILTSYLIRYLLYFLS